MTPGLREYKQSLLRIVIPDVPDDMRDGMREIASLESRDAGKGHATTLMWEVCNEADKAMMVLLLQPKAFADGLDDEKLKRFYAKFGFVLIQDNPPLMARKPDLKGICNE